MSENINGIISYFSTSLYKFNTNDTLYDMKYKIKESLPLSPTKYWVGKQIKTSGRMSKNIDNSPNIEELLSCDNFYYIFFRIGWCS